MLGKCKSILIDVSLNFTNINQFLNDFSIINEILTKNYLRFQGNISRISTNFQGFHFNSWNYIRYFDYIIYSLILTKFQEFHDILRNSKLILTFSNLSYVNLNKNSFAISININNIYFRNYSCIGRKIFCPKFKRKTGVRPLFEIFEITPHLKKGLYS